jgi:DNA-binding transcriptional LysR family regulator
MALLERLRYSAWVAEERHLGRAAERLLVTQASPSQQIKRLGAELDVQLLERDSQGLELISAGETLLAPCPPVPVRVQESQAQKHGYQHDRPPRGARPHLQASTSGIPRLSTPVSWDRSVLVRERAHRTARVEERETHKLTGRPARRCACPRSCSGQRL